MPRRNWDKERARFQRLDSKQALNYKKMSKVKAFKARFGGSCPSCDSPIEIGDFITWTKTFGAHHKGCSEPTLDVVRKKNVAPA